MTDSTQSAAPSQPGPAPGDAEAISAQRRRSAYSDAVRLLLARRIYSQHHASTCGLTQATLKPGRDALLGLVAAHNVPEALAATLDAATPHHATVLALAAPHHPFAYDLSGAATIDGNWRPLASITRFASAVDVMLFVESRLFSHPAALAVKYACEDAGTPYMYITEPV